MTKTLKPVRKAEKTSQSKGKSKAPKIAEPKKVLYPEAKVEVYNSNKPMTATIAKKLLGWVAEGENEDFGTEYHLKTLEGKKVRLTNCLTNRPFSQSLSVDWMIELLRGKWRLNGETIKIDRLGMIQDGQHRLAGLVMAEEEREDDLKLPEEERKWTFWEESPVMETFVIYGISEEDDVVNTIGTGKPRTLSDVIFRSVYFSDMSMGSRAKISKVAAMAIKGLWFATKADETSFAPRRPHSESLDFINRHSRLLECVKELWEEREVLQGELRIPLGYACALFYLMGTCTSDADRYQDTFSEESLDWKLWDTAEEFWKTIAAKDKSVAPLIALLKKYANELSGIVYAQALFSSLAKAWNLYSDKKPITAKGIDTKVYMDEDTGYHVKDHTKVGGIHLQE